MDEQFWITKWQKNEIGFHLESVHPLLKKFARVCFQDVSGVFVPLCGKSIDMQYLQSLGYKIVGVELSPLAVNQFYEALKSDQQFFSTKINEGDFILHQAKNISIFKGDIFDLEPHLLNNISGIYDRAALVALTNEQRKSYVAKLYQLFCHAKMLLITLTYDQTTMNGPPFSIECEEVNRLFADSTVKQVYSKNIIDKEPRFKAKGLTRFEETAYLIEW